MSRLKVAIVGTEHCHVRGNARMLSSRDDVDVVAVWGADEDKAAAVADTFGLAPLALLSDMPDVDLALVTTDTAGHLRAMQALAGRAHAVHVDKPLGLSRSDAEAVARYAEAYGDRFAVGLFARVNPLVRNLVERIRRGEIGAVQHAALTFGHAGRLEGWLDDWPAFNDPARMGYGSFGDLAALLLDIAGLLVGDLTPLNCVKQTDPRFALDVGGAALARAENGALVRLFSSAVMKGPRFDVRVDGETGSLWLRGKALGCYDENDLPVTLMEGEWMAAADSPSAFINKLLGQSCADYAGLEDGLKINSLLDNFEVLSQVC